MLRVLELFAGIGAASKALTNLGIEHEIVDAVEIDKYAVKSFNAIHGTNFESQDITEWDKDIKCDLIMHGSPCFRAGELVNTKYGLKPIESIKIGDIVKTDNGEYSKVIQTMITRNNHLVDIIPSCAHCINTTLNHPFLIYRDGERRYIEASQLSTKDYLCVPINHEHNKPKWNGVMLNYNHHAKVSNKLPLEDERLWYLFGRFIGDGWVCRRRERANNICGIKVCCGKHKLDHLVSKIDGLFKYCLVEERTVYKLQFSNKELGVFCEQFGVGASNKHIPQDILNLDEKYLRPLYDGIMDSDGYSTDKRCKLSTTSKQLAYNMGELVLKLFKVPYQVYKCKRPSKCVIEGRIVNQRDTYTTNWTLGDYNEHINFVDEDYLYSRVRKIHRLNENDTVYNLEVENSHTYCVNNIAVHNCQDFSVAGKQAGGDKGSGTRSSLMYETLRIVKKLKPKYVVWENVKNILSAKHRHNFDAYLQAMEDMGYQNHYQVLNAKDYGVPQNRERVFTVSILKDKVIYDDYNSNVRADQDTIGTLTTNCGSSSVRNGWKVIEPTTHFEFPEKEPLKIKLKDILEDKVDEKFYLSDEQVKRIKTSTFVTNRRRIQEKDWSDTLCARDFKDPKCVQVGTLDIKGNDQIKRVYSAEGISPTLTTMTGGNRQPKIVDDTYTSREARVYDKFSPTLRTGGGVFKVMNDNEVELPVIAASRGRNPKNPSDRTTGCPTEQRLEINRKGTSNTITSVQKDNYVIVGSTQEHAAVSKDGVSPTLTSSMGQGGGHIPMHNVTPRIRKLTPRECWRLMGFADADIQKAMAGGGI